jgi:hypothetical protein
LTSSRAEAIGLGASAATRAAIETVDPIDKAACVECAYRYYHRYGYYHPYHRYGYYHPYHRYGYGRRYYY